MATDPNNPSNTSADTPGPAGGDAAPASSYASAYGTAPAAPPPAPPRKPKRSNAWIYLTVIGLLLGTNVYLFLNQRNLRGSNNQLTSGKAAADSSYTAVNTEYQAALARLDDLVTRNGEMDSVINDQDGEIARLRDRIEGLLNNARRSADDVARAQRLIAQLNKRVRGYEERVAMLEAENRTLNTQVTTLSRERDQTTATARGLEEQVKLGQVLHASNIRLVPIDLRRGGRKEKETSRARRTDLLRVYFDIDENRIARSGSKELFLRVTAPDNTLLSNAAYGSGVTTGRDGTSMPYTLQKTVALAQGEPLQDIAVDWQQESNYARGTYTIEIYHDGYPIGRGEVALR